jgi:hypothetical protein
MPPLTRSDDWNEFPSTSECRTVFGGAANFAEISIPARGFRGLTLRLFDPERAEWSLYWASSRDCRLQPPVTGRFLTPTGRGKMTCELSMQLSARRFPVWGGGFMPARRMASPVCA